MISLLQVAQKLDYKDITSAEYWPFTTRLRFYEV